MLFLAPLAHLRFLRVLVRKVPHLSLVTLRRMWILFRRFAGTSPPSTRRTVQMRRKSAWLWSPCPS